MVAVLFCFKFENNDKFFTRKTNSDDYKMNMIAYSNNDHFDFSLCIIKKQISEYLGVWTFCIFYIVDM